MKRESLPVTPHFSSVRASFLTALVSRFEATGTNVQPLLNRTGITLAQLNDPYGAIPLPQFVAFLEAAAVETHNESIGARIGAQLTASDMGPVGIVLSLSENIENGITRFANYANALQEGAETQWIQQSDLPIPNRWNASFAALCGFPSPSTALSSTGTPVVPISAGKTPPCWPRWNATSKISSVQSHRCRTSVNP